MARVTSANSVGRARRLWWAMEPIHAMARHAPEAIDAMDRLGYPDPATGHLIARLAVLSPIDVRVRLAAAGWHVGPTLERAVLRHGDLVRPETVHTAQLHALDQTFWRLYGSDLVRSDSLVTASQLARLAADAADCRGRTLAAARQCLEWPTFPHLVLWQAASILCEHRAGGRRAALIAHDLTPLHGHLLDVAAGNADADAIRVSRAIMRPTWERSGQDLCDRGLLDGAGSLTASGRSICRAIDDQTDRAADQPLQALGDTDATALADSLAPFTRAVLDGGDLPPNRVLSLPAILPGLTATPAQTGERGSPSNGLSTASARRSVAAPSRSPGPDRAQRHLDRRPRRGRRRPSARL